MAALDSKIMDIKLANRKKCIAEYDDLYHVFYPNYSKKYISTLNENPQVFRTYKGIFTNMYDAANRNGNIIEVFKKSNLKINENKKEGSPIKKDKINKNFGNLLTNNSILSNRGSGYNKNNSENVAKIMAHDNDANFKIKNSPKKKN